MPGSLHKPRSLALLLAASAALAGCYSTTTTAATPVRGEAHVQSAHLFLLGTVGEAEVDVRDYCLERPAAEVRTYGNAATTIVTIVTVGIYSPRRVRIVCGAEVP